MAAHQITVKKLPEDEGSIVALSESSTDERFILRHTLSSFVLVHGGDEEEGCYGQFSDIRISKSKRVLFCSICGLRIPIPVSAISLQDLQ